MQKTVLISGATSGIGLACAEVFAKNNYNIILTGRRGDRLSKLEEEFKSKYSVDISSLNFDIRDKDAVIQAVKSLKDNNITIDVLINNAGLASGLNTVQEGDYDDWNKMIDTNVKGLLYISREILPMMIKQGSGHIINIGSIAGKEVYPNGNVYCATKHAVDAITKGMRIDAVKHGIRVSQIAPGAVETEFSVVRFHGDKEKADAVYKGFEPLHPEDVADAVFYVANTPKHVNINDLVIMPTAQASATIMHKTE
ncbi:MAG: NAD(P)-dependent oxidoreductase [Marinilabiliales bacterium]|nr:MAG: NAD(P)-dependent oxidoreductase [Marinilabiliales bacterium]